jgi:hypothetical protein
MDRTRRNQLSCEGGNRRKQKSSTHERSSPSLTRNLINEFQKTAADEKTSIQSLARPHLPAQSSCLEGNIGASCAPGNLLNGIAQSSSKNAHCGSAPAQTISRAIR